MAMAAAGLAAAASPFVVGQQVAGAAVTHADDSDALTFVTYDGAAITCSISIFTTHDTDNANQPRLRWEMSGSGGGTCFEEYGTVVTATFKDNQGVTRRVESSSASIVGGSVTGAKSATSVWADIYFYNCNPNQSPSCSISLTASPK